MIVVCAIVVCVFFIIFNYLLKTFENFQSPGAAQSSKRWGHFFKVQSPVRARLAGHSRLSSLMILYRYMILTL